MTAIDLAPLLAVTDLSTQFDTRQGLLTAVNQVSFSLQRGEILGLVGESGSGKSVTGFSLMGLVDAPGRVAGGSIRFEGRELIGQTTQQWQHLRGNEIAMIFQDPMMTLNPVLRVDTQMLEALHAHQSISRTNALARVREVLVQVGIASPDERLIQYPHQFSGGMRQRLAIACALLNRPKLIIADEPTTALDVTVQGQILYEMQALVRQQGTALIWITHDLAIVAGLADRVAVMYAGRIVEMGTVEQVLDAPAHPYTRGLLNSVPANTPAGKRLQSIVGIAPSLANLPLGCAFQERCPDRREACTHADATQLRLVKNAQADARRWARCISVDGGL
jgi:peptide/nickel transport system ATP-binding protein